MGMIMQNISQYFEIDHSQLNHYNNVLKAI